MGIIVVQCEQLPVDLLCWHRKVPFSLYSRSPFELLIMYYSKIFITFDVTRLQCRLSAHGLINQLPVGKFGTCRINRFV